MKSINNYKLSLKKDWLFLLITSVIGIFIILFIGFSLQTALAFDRSLMSSDNKKKIALFNREVPLVCTLSPGVFSNALIINKQDGWSVFSEEYFKKENQLINIVNCVEVEE
mgnify:CR=1 FL=1